jgi:hypothetical protein
MKHALIALFFMLLVLPISVQAQLATDFSEATQSLSISFNPAYPAPGELVTASLDDYSVGALFSNITWSVNGQSEPILTNNRTFSFQAPQLGEPITIGARLTLPGGTSIETSKTITPIYTDIIVEPQTYTPQMYAGRALPTIGSLVRASAFVQNNNGPITPSNYSYLWKLNGTTLGGGTKNGDFQTSYIVPYGASHTLTVEVYDQNGSLITRRGTSVRTAEVDLKLYEVSTLYGLGNNSLGKRAPFIGNTMTIRAVPYNLDLRSSPGNTFFEWRNDNQIIRNATGDPYEVTLERTGQGQGTITFKLRHREALLQGGEVSTILNF